jgi:hypothetical protein
VDESHGVSLIGCGPSVQRRELDYQGLRQPHTAALHLGTDWPHPQMHDFMPDDGDLLDLLLECVPDTTVRNRILADNPARLYGFA